MNAIDNHLAAARDFVKERIVSAKTKKIPAVYRGYVSSFGVDVRQSGVLPTLLLYNATDANTRDKEGRPNVVVGVCTLLGYTNKEAFIDAAYAAHTNPNPAPRNALRRKVMDAAVALKLAMRTFPFEDGPTPTATPQPTPVNA